MSGACLKAHHRFSLTEDCRLLIAYRRCRPPFAAIACSHNRAASSRLSGRLIDFACAAEIRPGMPIRNDKKRTNKMRLLPGVRRPGVALVSMKTLVKTNCIE